MSILIDKLVADDSLLKRAKALYVGDGWFIAKPLEIFSIRGRLKDAWRVLVGRSRTYHYRRDE